MSIIREFNCKNKTFVNEISQHSSYWKTSSINLIPTVLTMEEEIKFIEGQFEKIRWTLNYIKISPSRK